MNSAPAPTSLDGDGLTLIPRLPLFLAFAHNTCSSPPQSVIQIRQPFRRRMDTPMYLTDTECDSTLAMELDLDHHESDHDYMQVSNDESLDDFGFFGALSNDREEDWALFDDTLTWDGRGWNL